MGIVKDELCQQRKLGNVSGDAVVQRDRGKELGWASGRVRVCETSERPGDGAIGTDLSDGRVVDGKDGVIKGRDGEYNGLRDQG